MPSSPPTTPHLLDGQGHGLLQHAPHSLQILFKRAAQHKRNVAKCRQDVRLDGAVNLLAAQVVDLCVQRKRSSEYERVRWNGACVRACVYEFWCKVSGQWVLLVVQATRDPACPSRHFRIHTHNDHN